GRRRAAGRGRVGAAAVDGGFGPRGETEHDGHRLGRAEVVVHRRPELGHRGVVERRVRSNTGDTRPAGQRVEPGDRLAGAVQLAVADLDRAAVVALEHRHAHRARAVGVDGVVQRREVAERLRHLLGSDHDHAVVDPVPGEAVAGTLGLGALVLVVGEDQVVAAAVDVEALPQQVERHRRALDVPAGPALAPGRVPRRLPRLGRLPEREVDRVALALVDVDARAGRLEEIVQPAVRELPVLGERRDVEVHALPLDDVRATGVHELADELHHPVDVPGRARQRVGAAHAEPRHLPPVGRLVPLGDLRLGAALLGGAGDDLVFDVRDVADEVDVEAAPLEIPADDVEHDRGATVTDVRHLVHGRATDVYRDPTGVAGDELDLLARERVVEKDHPSSTLSRSATAQTAIPSLRPIAPRPSPRLGFTDTRFCAPGSGNRGTRAWYRLSVMLRT